MATGPTITTGAAVTHKRKELQEYAADYRLIADLVAGQRKVRAAGTRYLPMPNPDDTSDANQKRYTAYQNRAVFYNVAQNTLGGMVGEVFARDPVAELPTSLDVFNEDADGGGLTLTQLAKRAVRFTLSKGRAGVLADYPVVEEGVTVADIESGDVQPTITVYDADNVINWRTKRMRAKKYLTLVVLVETYDGEDDGFAVTKKTQHRVLRLEDGVYTSQIYRDGNPLSEPQIPKDSKGDTFDHIPFTFIGSENNDEEIDHPPMLSLCDVNAGHYRNSADYEEGVYMTGQATPVFTGLTEDWVKNVMQGKVHLGSRGGVMLPEGGSANLMQMEANTAAFEAMQHKERQMVALGAKLVEQKEVQRTATEVDMENSSETSVLSNVAKNVSAAIKFALEVCARFTGDAGAEIVYELNTDFNIARMTAQERTQVISEWQSGAITFSEMRATLRKSGIATLDDKDAKEEIAAEVDMMGHNGGPGMNEEFDEDGNPIKPDDEDDGDE